ncbi:sperm flagellar protein 1-like [Parus major]|uniref:sperm flagellar protein 1-like n=1 Tax=Parus major TaxID=9157 RepID=UPI00077159A2|nr:sperm flagellar protein 1-like [Parus major]
MAAEGPGPSPDTSLVSLYRWLDTVPLSRPRRNIARDFSDGVLAAEVVKFFFPSLVELHSFVPTSSTAQKVANWGHLNRKVLSKLNLRVPEEMIQQLVRSRPGMAEQLLQLLREKIQERQRQRKEGAGQPPAEPAAREEVGYLDTGHPKVQSDLGRGCSQEGAASSRNFSLPPFPSFSPSFQFFPETRDFPTADINSGKRWDSVGWEQGDIRNSHFSGGEKGLRSEPQILSCLSFPQSERKKKAKIPFPHIPCGGNWFEDFGNLGFGDLGIWDLSPQIPREWQILQAKVGRLEQLLLLKNLRIDDLSRQLQQLQGHRR